jgi:hypothetical protein
VVAGITLAALAIPEVMGYTKDRRHAGPPMVGWRNRLLIVGVCLPNGKEHGDGWFWLPGA